MFESEPHIYRLIQINDRLISSSKPAIHRYKILKQIAVPKSGKNKQGLPAPIIADIGDLGAAVVQDVGDEVEAGDLLVERRVGDEQRLGHALHDLLRLVRILHAEDHGLRHRLALARDVPEDLLEAVPLLVAQARTRFHRLLTKFVVHQNYVQNYSLNSMKNSI